MPKPLSIALCLTPLALLGAAPALAQTTGIAGDSPAAKTTQQAVNQSLMTDLNSALGSADNAVVQVEGSIDDAFGAANGAIDDAMASIQTQIDQVMGSLGDFGQIGQTINQAGGIVDRATGLPASISSRLDALIARFNLERILGGFQLPNILTDVLGGINSGSLQQTAQTISSSIGALGLPDPRQIQVAIEQAEPSQLEQFLGVKHGGDGSPVAKADLQLIFDADLAREVAQQAALSEAGQQTLLENAQAANAALETSSELAQDSEGQDVSQNILRNLSGQLQAAQQTDTLLTLDAQMRARDDALRNLVLADALEQLQQERTAQRQLDASAFSSVITQGGLFYVPGMEGEE